MNSAIHGSTTVLSTVCPPMNGNLTKGEEEGYINSLKYIINEMDDKKWIKKAVLLGTKR